MEKMKHKFFINAEDIKTFIGKESFLDGSGRLVVLSDPELKISPEEIEKIVEYFNNEDYHTPEFKEDSGAYYLLKRLKYIVDKYYKINKDYQERKYDQEEQHKYFTWWIAQNRSAVDGTLICHYCGTSEMTYYRALSHASEGDGELKDGRLIKSKKGKNTWNTPNMEIDEVIPRNKNQDNRNYDFGSNGNCVFACHFCNNAKSDLIKGNDFKRYIGKAVGEFLKEAAKD